MIFLYFYFQNVFPDPTKYCGPYKPKTNLWRSKHQKGKIDPSAHDTIGNVPVNIRSTCLL